MQVADVYRALRRIGALKPPTSNTTIVLGGTGLVIAISVYMYLVKHQLRFMARGMGYTLTMFVVIGPLALIAAFVHVKIARHRDRPKLPFEFPLIVPLTAARACKIDDGIAYLTQWGHLICLIRRTDAPELPALLDELDPGHEFAVDTYPDRLDLELEGKAPAFGFLRKLPAPNCYALVLASTESAEKELQAVLANAYTRMPNDPTQRWREPDESARRVFR